MKNTLRFPVVEVLNEFEIKVNSKGSLLRLVVFSILGLIAPAVFGLAIWTEGQSKVGVFVAFLSAFFVVFFGYFALFVSVIISMKQPKFLVFDVDKKLIFKHSIFGKVSFSPLNISTIKLFRNNYGRYWSWRLSIDFDGESLVFLEGYQSYLAKSTYQFVIDLLEDSIQLNDVNQAFEKIKNRKSYSEIFEDLYKPSCWEIITNFLSKYVLYLFAFVLFLGVGVLVVSIGSILLRDYGYL
jgi:hypothetical protein